MILVVQEIFGVHEHIKDVCRRFAKLGYSRHRTRDVRPSGRRLQSEGFPGDPQDRDEGPRRPGHVRPGRGRGLCEETGKADTAKLGITGFCWGGRIVWLYGAHNPNLKAGVAWYGRLVGQADDLHPKHPVRRRRVDQGPHPRPLWCRRPGIPVASVDKMRTAMKEAGNTAEIIVYPDTPHAFFADYRPSYRKEQAEDGWKRLLEWFQEERPGVSDLKAKTSGPDGEGMTIGAAKGRSRYHGIRSQRGGQSIPPRPPGSGTHPYFCEGPSAGTSQGVLHGATVFFYHCW